MFAVALLLISCSDTDDSITNVINDVYSVKEYALERDPKVNVWGAGMDFVHPDSSPDYQYLIENSVFPYDIKFFIVKVYFKDDKGDTKNEGSPALILSPNVQACRIGEGITFFNEFKTVTPEILAQLKADLPINYDSLKNSTGMYDRKLVHAALDKLIIGQQFRSGSLVVPEGLTEEQVQPVFLIKTPEGKYAKFMVKQFMGEGPDQKKTTFRWIVLN